MDAYENINCERYSSLRSRLQDKLTFLLEPSSASLAALYTAMAYSVLQPGKCLRPLLAYSACEAMGGPIDAADGVACAVELMHTYSLIHDDLPALDNATTRRGKPALHLAFSESTALLAGDALQALAFECLTQPPSLTAADQVRMVAMLARAVGPSGLAGGQFLDMTLSGMQPALGEIDEMQRLKTGALIEASVMLGASASGASAEDSRLLAIRQYAANVGRAFQVRDDILDMTGNVDLMGKPINADLHADKKTFASALGLEEAQEYATQLISAALTVLVDFGHEADSLRHLARFIIERDS